MDTAPCTEIRIRQRYRAAASRVFDAWLDPGIAGGWLFATALHPMSGVSIDARVGGSFCFVGHRGEEFTGNYLEIVRPRRLVFTLAGKSRPQGAFRVCVEIAPHDAGCELSLALENVSPDDASRTENRWTGMLYGLGETLKGRQQI
jgi:uncharacterized protein YndB with AHSA1/START domain